MIVTGLRKIGSWVVTIAIIANVSGAFVLLTLVAIMNVDVVSRNLLNAPFRGVVEMVIFLLAFIVFLQLPDVVRTGKLTRSDGFLGLMRSRAPRFGGALARFLDGIACVFMCLIVWTVWPEFTESFESCQFFQTPDYGIAPTGDIWADFKTGLARCDYFGTPGILQAPWWPVRLAIAFGCAWAAILFFFKIILGDDDHKHVTAQTSGEV